MHTTHNFSMYPLSVPFKWYFSLETAEEGLVCTIGPAYKLMRLQFSMMGRYLQKSVAR